MLEAIQSFEAARALIEELVKTNLIVVNDPKAKVEARLDAHATIINLLIARETLPDTDKVESPKEMYELVGRYTMAQLKTAAPNLARMSRLAAPCCADHTLLAAHGIANTCRDILLETTQAALIDITEMSAKLDKPIYVGH